MIASPRLSPPWMLPLPYVSSLSLLELCEQVQRSSGEASGRDGTLSWERAAGCRYHIQGCSELTRIASLPPRAPAHPDPPPWAGSRLVRTHAQGHREAAPPYCLSFSPQLA